MYPSDSAPNYGVFVQNTEKILVDAGMDVDRTVMFKHNGKLRKLVSYIRYYAEILMKGLSNTYDVTYVHYASHNAIPLLLLKRLKSKRLSIRMSTEVMLSLKCRHRKNTKIL